MEELIEETKRIAQARFQTFGFGEAQIEQLLASGERDLKKELAHLRELLMQEPCDLDAINRSLHALKGLVLNMGNDDAAEKLSELRGSEDPQEKIETLKRLTHIA